MDSDYDTENVANSDTSGELNNVWNVNSIYDLQFFNCPDEQCNFKHSSKQEFIDHVCDNHAEYLILRNSISDGSLDDINNPLIDTPSTSKNKGGRPPKKLLDSSKRVQKSRLQSEFDRLKEICENEECTYNVLLGIFGRLFCNHFNDQKLAKLFDIIASGIDPLEGKTLDEKTCHHIKECIKIGQAKWDHLRKLLEPAGVTITSRYKLQKYAIDKQPPIEKFENGVWLPLAYALPVILTETLECEDSYCPSNENPDSLELTALCVLMYDGSGSHAQVQGKDININTRSLVIG